MIFVLGTEATLQERRKLLQTMLDGVYIDSKEEKRIVAIKPKPVFKAIFQIADTLEDSGIILLKNEGKAKRQKPIRVRGGGGGGLASSKPHQIPVRPARRNQAAQPGFLGIIDLLIERGSLGLANCDT